MNQIPQILMSNLQQRLKVSNPGMFEQYNKWVQGNANPMDLFKQITGNYSPEQMQNFMNFAKGFGVPDSLLQQIQMWHSLSLAYKLK